MQTSFGVVGTLLFIKGDWKAGKMCVPEYATAKVPPEGAFLRNISPTLVNISQVSCWIPSVYLRRHWQVLGTHAQAVSVTEVATISGN
jgi:hypothetical protein